MNPVGPRRLAVLFAALVLAACDHGGPFTTPGNATDQPFAPGAPTRLTYNAGVDHDPTWLPDGSGILYSSELLDRRGNRCLVLLPPAGGRIQATFCNEDSLAADSLKFFDAPAVSATGRIAFERQSRPPANVAPTYDELAIGTLDSLGSAAARVTLPFTMGGTLYTGIAQLRWLGTDAVAFRAGYAATTCITSGAPCATAYVTSGFGLMVDTAPGSSPPALLAGTAGASSLWASVDGDALYFTLNNDSRVMRLVRSTGVTTVYWDFGAGQIARDVQVSGSRLIAVLGGNVQTVTAPDGTPLQYDQGGVLTMVDVSSNTTTVLSDPRINYLHPALSPDGKHVVAESGGDLWLFDLP